MCALLKNSKDFFNNFKMVKDILKIERYGFIMMSTFNTVIFFFLLSNKRALLKKSRKQNL